MQKKYLKLMISLLVVLFMMINTTSMVFAVNQFAVIDSKDEFKTAVSYDNLISKEEKDIVDTVYSNTINTLKNVTYYDNEKIINQLSPKRIRSIDVLNKRMEMAKEKGVVWTQIPESEATMVLKKENLYELGFEDPNLDDFFESNLKELISDSLKMYSGDKQDRISKFTNFINNNPEQFILGVNYIKKVYDFSFSKRNPESTNLANMLMFEPERFENSYTPLELIQKIGSQGEANYKLSNTLSMYDQVLRGSVSNSPDLLSFIEECFNKNKDDGANISEWYNEETNAYVYCANKMHLYDRLKADTSLKEYILPLLSVSKQSVYVIGTDATITIGHVSAYEKLNEAFDESNFIEKIKYVGDRQQSFIDFWKRMAIDKNTANLLNSNRLVVDTLRIGTSTATTSREQWSDKVGTNTSLGIREFITPMGLYRNFLQAGGEAEGQNIRMYMSKGLEDIGLTTYAHEMVHLYDDTVMLGNKGLRDGLQGEFYPRGMFEPADNTKEPIINLNTIFDRSTLNDSTTNETPERFNTIDDVNTYMKNMMDVIYTLEYVEADSVLKRSNEDKIKWFNQVTEIPDSSRVTSQHTTDRVDKISEEMAAKLSNIDSLVENNIIAARYEIDGLKTEGTIRSNGYYSIPLFTSNFAAVENKNGVSGDVMTRRLAYELLAEFGYYKGLVPYISNEYKNIAINEGSVFSDTYILGKVFNGKYANITEFKKAMYNTRINKLKNLKPVKINYEGNYIQINSYDDIKQLMDEAITADLKNGKTSQGYNIVRPFNSKVEVLKKAIYLGYMKQTDDYRSSIYENKKEKYNIIYSVIGETPNDFVLPNKKSYYENDKVTVEANLISNSTTNKAGKQGRWLFSGWIPNDKSLLIISDQFDMPGEDVVLTGKWTFKEDIKLESTEVDERIPLNSILLNKKIVTINAGESENLVVSYNPKNTTDSKDVVWKSENPNVATVTNGIVKAISAGTTKITATVGNINTSATVNIKLPSTGIEVNADNFTLSKGESKFIQATLLPVGNTDNATFSWTSSNTNIVNVKDGVVTAKGKGTADIKVTALVEEKKYEKNITIIVTPSKISRLGGNNRYETAALINNKMKSDTIILVTGNDFADALSATSLIKSSNGEIHLVNKKLDNNTLVSLNNGEFSKAIIVGGTGVVSKEIEDKVKNILGNNNVTRLGGSNRYETSESVVSYISNNIPYEFRNYPYAFAVTGKNFADALSVAPIAAMTGSPIVLTEGNDISTVSASALKKATDVYYKVGGESVVGNGIDRIIGNNYKRLFGANRYETNKAVIKEFNDLFIGDSVYVSTGLDFPDSLSGSALAGKNKSSIIFVSKAIDNYTNKVVSELNKSNVVALGGSSVVPNSVMNELIN